RNLLDRTFGGGNMENSRLRGRNRTGGCRPRGRRRTDVFQRQIQRKGAARAGRTAQMDFAAQEVRQLAADRKTKPRSTVLAAGARVGLLECLENDLLLFQRDADASVRYLERHYRRRLIEHRV